MLYYSSIFNSIQYQLNYSFPALKQKETLIKRLLEYGTTKSPFVSDVIIIVHIRAND